MFLPFEMIIAHETVRMRRQRKKEDADTYGSTGDARKVRRENIDDKINENNQLHKIIAR